jgi:GT2 family glycosyltransferase
LEAKLPQPAGDAGEPLVSIFMPAYNAGRFLRQAIQSVLAQTYRNIELVLLDDASTDETARIAQSSGDPRVVYRYNERNLGQFRSMSRAVELTRGEFIAIFHADDVYEPEIVAEELAYLRANSTAGAVFSQDNIINEQGEIVARVRLPSMLRNRVLITYEDVYRYLLRHKNQIICCPTFMVRRSVLAQIGPFDAARYRIAGDLDMWIRILRQYPVGILNQRLINYRKSSGQESSKYRRLRTTEEEFFEIMDRYGSADGWGPRLTADERREYEFHRLDDRTFRAANLVILGQFAQAGELLRGRFAWASLLLHPRRRKLRTALLRWLMRMLLAIGGQVALRRLLLRVEYQIPVTARDPTRD